MADLWYYMQGGRQLGPIEAKELVRLAAAGQVQRTDPVWKEGMAGWEPAGTVEGLFAGPPPPPSSSTPPPPPGADAGMAGSVPGNSATLVYPSDPPKDPILMALLSGCCIFPWIGHVVLGQTKKGLILMAICVTLVAIGIGVVAWPIAAVDAYLTAKKLKDGQPVTEWEFFGSWDPFI